MLIQTPALNGEQIENWIRDGVQSVRLPKKDNNVRVSAAVVHRHHPGFDFKKARLALQRARAKTAVHTIKPLRRLRTNQAAVNESLIDALASTLAVNRAMAEELAELATEVAELRARLNGGPHPVA